jgi:hypothetical protein
MVWELYLPQEYDGCGVMYGLYARLPEADRDRLHAGTKVPLDAGMLTRDQTRAVAAWFNSARWGCDPPPERLEAHAVRNATIVLKCEDSVVEFCLQSPDKGIWRKLTIAGAPERAEWVRDGLPLLPAWWHAASYTDWEGGTHPPVPPPDDSHYSYNRLRDLYSAYANLPADVLRELHQGTGLSLVSLPLAKLPPGDQDAIASACDRETAMHNSIAGWPAETLRTPEMRRRHFGITTVDFICRTDLDSGDPHIVSIPRPHRVVFLEAHFSPWAVAERSKYWREFGESGVAYAKANLGAQIAMPAAVQRHLCAWRKKYREWSDEWTYDIDGSHPRKPSAPPPPNPWPGLRSWNAALD